MLVPKESIALALVCPNDCSGNGDCTTQGCTCQHTHTSNDCSVEIEYSPNDRTAETTSTISPDKSNTMNTEPTPELTTPQSLLLHININIDTNTTDTLTNVELKAKSKRLAEHGDRINNHLNLPQNDGIPLEEEPLPPSIFERLVLKSISQRADCKLVDGKCNKVVVFGTGFDASTECVITPMIVRNQPRHINHA